jgi:thiol:disulfide interchange protein DsbC
MVDTKTRTNLTEARIDKLTAVDFALPLKDAMVIKQGNGSRKLAVFVDPNCGYCKRFERDLLTVKDVTIYTFLIPSWARTRPPSRATSGAPRTRQGLARLDGRRRGAAQGRGAPATPRRWTATWPSARHRINGTPALFFEDGTRKPGAMSADAVDKLLAAARKK